MVIRNCFELDGNMNMIAKEPMKAGRFNTALALLSDKYIFAIGGNIGRGKSTEIVECFDTSTNSWN
jgi:hypothetical protein